MGVRIAHASQDENGKYSNGKAGDQTGKEVTIRSWYNRPWNVVLICKDTTMREKIAVAMEAACKNDQIGYDQYQRNSLLTYARPVGYNPALVNMDCECDCSSLVSVCCMYAGISESVLFKGNNCCTTSTIRKALMGTGLFEEHTDSKYVASEDYLQRGSILLYEGHHVAVSIDNGSKATNSSNKVNSNFSVGVDVSSYQKTIDWSKVKASGVQFAALKIIRKDLNKDEQFENNYNGCIKNNIEIKGVYNYSYAITTAKAISDAETVIKYLNGRKLTVWLDVEDDCQKNLGSKLIDIIIAYKDTIEKAGLEFGVYTGLSFYNSFIKSYLNGLNLRFWIARYGGNNDGTFNEKYKPDVDNMVCWQYTSGGVLPGINAKVDMNVWYNNVNVNTTNINTTTTNTTTTTTNTSVLGKVTASALNIRSTYNTNGSILGQYKNGDIIKLLESKNGWYKTNKGWVSGKYVNTQVFGKVVKCVALNVRKDPKVIKDNVLFTISKDTKVQIICLSEDDKWINIKVNNKIGWCSTTYVEY